MKEQITLVKELFEKIKILGLSTIELVKLRFYNKLTNVIALLITDLVVLLSVLVMLFFFNIALALWIGELLGKMYFGFLAVGLFYGIIGLLSLFFFKNIIFSFIKKSIIKHL